MNNHLPFRLANLAFLSFFSLIMISCTGQTSDHNPYKLAVVSDYSVYEELMKANPDKRLVNLEEHIPGIKTDIRYATTNNFTGRRIYESPKAFVRKPVADSLLVIQKELSQHGLGLKVFDAYRPYAATVKFYELYRDTTFVASPYTGSVHNTACAVDVTLIDLDTGAEIPMPTAFDEFTEKASHHYIKLPDTLLNNRKILKDVMIKHAFLPYDAEWWHYSFVNYAAFEYLDIPIKEISN